MFDDRDVRRGIESCYEGYLGSQSYHPWQISHYYLVSSQSLNTCLKCMLNFVLVYFRRAPRHIKISFQQIECVYLEITDVPSAN